MSWIEILLIGGGVVLVLLLLAKTRRKIILASQREVHSLPSSEVSARHEPEGLLQPQPRLVIRCLSGVAGRTDIQHLEDPRR